MEYLGYVAANNPPPNYYLRRPPPPPPPQRSNSTKVTSPTKKSRFPGGHRRTNSSDSSRSRSHEIASPPFPVAAPPPPHDRPQLSAPALQGDRPLNQQQQKQYAVSRQFASPSNRNKELPLPPPPLIEELDLGPRPSSSPPISPSQSGAILTSVATPAPLSSIIPSNPSPAPPPFPSPSTTTAASRRKSTSAAAAETTTKRKIRKHRREPGEGEKIEEEERLQDIQDRRHREQEQEKKQGQEQGRQQRDQGYEYEQDHDHDYDHNHNHNHEHEREYGHEHGHELEPQKTLHQGVQQQINYVSIVPVPTALFSKSITKPFTRNESVSSASGPTALSIKTMLSSEPPSSADGGGSSSQSLLSTTSNQAKPFVVRNGRTYLADPSLPYPLPVDLAELHRQSLRSLLLFQLFGGPVCSPSFANKPPTRVLEVGCGSAFWSIMCNQYFTRQGHRGISFSGIDIAPIGLGVRGPGGKGRSSQSGPDKEKDNMNWRFVQHDMRRLPWPFAAEEFDLVMIKDVSLAMRSDTYQLVFDECIRLLQPGGTLEVWDSDHAIRLLRPHLPTAPTTLSADEEDDYDSAVSAGAYVLTPNTPLSAPLNNYIVEYNAWLVKALESRSLPFAQCALAGALFLQEAESLTNVSSRRLAVPLSEMRWEREGVGGVVTKDGKTYIETKGLPKTKGKGRDAEQGKKKITPAQSALRRTALLTVVQLIQSLEPILREVSGKSQDEWDGWSGKMMNDLMKENGTFWGECLEVGAWWAQKR